MIHFYRFNERKRKEGRKEGRKEKHRAGVREKRRKKVKTLEKYIKVVFLKLYKL